MTTPGQELWLRVKERLRAEVGEEIFSSWFGRMECDSVESPTVKHSVPTRFLRSWIQSHYAEKLLACWQAELATVSRIELTMRSPVIRSSATVGKTETAATPKGSGKPNGAPAIGPVSAIHEALGGSPLDPRLTF